MMRLAFLALALTASGCDRAPGDQGLADRVADRVEAGPGTVVDLADLAPFAWSRLHVFEPYTTEEVAEQRMGVPWPDRWAWSEVDRLDDRFFLVFLHEGEVVSAFDYRIQKGRFAASEILAGGIGPEAARFVVGDRGDGVLALVPEAEVPDRQGGGE